MKENILLSPRSQKKHPKLHFDLHELPIAGVTPFSTVDFPNRLAAVLYTQGCHWRCRFCYNSDFWEFKPSDHKFSTEIILQFLMERKGLLDGVVFSGGEPTCHIHLEDWMKVARGIGYDVALHTSGMFPKRLQKVLPFCDWVSMDVKTLFTHYENITQTKWSGREPRKSVEVIVRSGVDHEFHTVFHPFLLNEKMLLQIGERLSEMGVRNYSVRGFHAEGCNDEDLSRIVLPEGVISGETYQKLSDLFDSFSVIS